MEVWRLESERVVVARSTRGTFATVEIPLAPEATALPESELEGFVRDIVTRRGGPLPSCQAVLLEIGAGRVTVQLGGPLRAVDYWLEDLRLVDILDSAVAACRPRYAVDD